METPMSKSARGLSFESPALHPTVERIFVETVTDECPHGLSSVSAFATSKRTVTLTV